MFCHDCCLIGLELCLLRKNPFNEANDPKFGKRRRLGVYLGAPNAAAYAPQGSFINALEHSPDDLANLLRQLDADEDAYKSYFAWRLGDDDSTPGHFTDVISNSLMGQHMDGFEWVCKLCKLYHLHYDWETAQRDSLFASSNSVDDIQRQHLHA